MRAAALFTKPWLTRLARGLLLALVAGVAVTALLWFILQLWVVPRLDSWRPQMQEWASRQLGQAVQIEGVRADSDGWRVSVVIKGIVIRDDRQQTVVTVPELQLRASPASLWRQSPDRLVLVRPRMHIWRDGQGQVWVGGVALPAHPAGAEADERLWNAMLKVGRILIREGYLQWRDERLGDRPLVLTQLSLDWRNQRFSHSMTLTGHPPEEWGTPFSVSAVLHTPLLRSASMKHVSGQVRADFPDLRVQALNRHVDTGVDLQSAQGQVNLDAEIKGGILQAVVVTGEVRHIQARFAQDLTPLDLRDASGRLVYRPLADGFSLEGDGLRFVTAGGQTWDDAKVHVSTQGISTGRPNTDLRAERVNLAALRHVLVTLPLDPSVHAAMRRHPVTGWVPALEASWQRDEQGMLRYKARGQVQRVAVASANPVPGISGLSGEFSFSDTGGEASLHMNNGRLSFPGIFDEPDIPVDALQARVGWRHHGNDWSLQVKELVFRNPDAQGEFDAQWRTLPDSQLSEDGSRFPGVLDLRGKFAQADGARVYRYLPKAVGHEAIRYVREAVQAGRGQQVTVQVSGNLAHFPFADSQQGTFRIAAPVHGVMLNYVPQYLLQPNEAAWPALVDLQGLLVFEGGGMQVHNATGRVQGHPGIRFEQIETRIPDLSRTRVVVKAKGRADAQAGLRFANDSAVSQWLGGALKGMSASGEVGIQLGLDLPVGRLDDSKVQGDIVLQGNEVSLLPSVPRLLGAQGRVHFNERGFSLLGVQAQSLGGLVELRGGTERENSQGRASTLIRAHGRATVEGLQQEPALAYLAPLVAHAQGAADYDLQYRVDDGAVGVRIHSGLDGVALMLPEPFRKTAAASWPLSVVVTPGSDGDEVAVTVADWFSARYVRETQAGGNLQVKAGVLSLGADAVAGQTLPARGVQLQVRQKALDLGLWQQWWTGVPQGLVNSGMDASTSASAAYLPKAIDLRVDHVSVGEHAVERFQLQADQAAGGAWQGRIDSDRVAGQLVFAPLGDGQLRLRLSRLHLPDMAGGVHQEQASALDAAQVANPRPAPDGATKRWPSMDVVVDELRIGVRQLGRLGVQASHRPGTHDDGAWVLHGVSLENEAARLQASGVWLPAEGAGGRRTRMQFELNVADSGALLEVLGMPGLVKQGSGLLHGVMSWQGSPFSPSLPTLEGQLHAELVKGQFLKADPGLAKLLGVLSLQTLPRRLSLDFHDVFSQGFAFDFIQGDAQVSAGVASTNNLQMKGVSAAVLMDGRADLQAQTQDLRVVVTPSIDAGSAALVATMINPAVGLGTFVAQLVLSRQINSAATRTLHITGDWADPQVQHLPGKVPHDALPPDGATEPSPAGSGAAS